MTSADRRRLPPSSEIDSRPLFPPQQPSMLTLGGSAPKIKPPANLRGYADRVQQTLNETRPQASVNEIRLANGKSYYAESGFLHRGGKPHPLVKKILDEIPLKKQSPWHGECGEIENLTKILEEHPQVQTLEQARELFRGATSESMRVRPPGDPMHGSHQRPCGDTCKIVLKSFGIEAPKPPQSNTPGPSANGGPDPCGDK